jgi:hypothetical protein
VRSKPEHVDGDLTILDEKTLAHLRGEILKEETLKLPTNMAGYIQQAAKNRHFEKLTAHELLRETIATWAGYEKHAGLTDAEIYRKFYITFNTDVFSSQTLNKKETETLIEKIKNETHIPNN